MNDSDIIALYFQRKQEAIDETAKKYGAYCFKVSYSILENQETAEECLNDTWFETWNSIPPQKPNVLKLFLAKITRNLSLDRYRMMHAQKRGSGEIPLILDELEEVVASTNNLEADVYFNLLLESLDDFLNTLNEADRTIFLQRYFYASDINSIAREAGITVNAMRVRLHRLRQKLSSYLTQKGYTL